MFNFKICGFAAGSAFVLSLIIGLLSGVGFLSVLFRAIIFAIVFFVLSCLVFWLVAQFMPELLSDPEDDLGFSGPGSRVDISVGEGPIVGAFPADNSEKVDDIAGRPSTIAAAAASPLDQGGNEGYNEKRVFAADLRPAAGSASSLDESFDLDVSLGTGKAEALPDIGGIGESVTAGSTEEVTFDSSEPRRPKSSSRKSEMAGDFNPKELAQAIQTVLKKDEKG
ncbi:MAG: hypothetical protein FWG27_09065 [Treponema sp.]|nr:hypothetical protein [Treponema sp.]